MKYVFVKRYNPAYDFFMMKYFREGGVPMDENLTFEGAGKMQIAMHEKPELTLHEKLFDIYITLWRDHPEARPSVSYLFEKMLGEVPDVRKLIDLESQLPEGFGKLLFSEEEVAEEISRFYKRYMKDELKRDLDRGAVGKQLAKHFSDEESKLLPDIRVVGLDRMEEATHMIAGDLLAWLGKITPEEVKHDMEHLLEEHSHGNDLHTRILDYSIYGDTRKARFCEHKSDYVKLTVYQYDKDNTKSVYLEPVRGFRVWERHSWEDDWASIVFPQYHVKIMN